MYIPFNQLSASSKVWIYASKTPFSENQQSGISEILTHFTDTWQAHGVELKASFEIKHNHFIIIGVDEQHHAPSGCSIDKSVQVIKNIESQFNINLMDRMVVYALEGDSIKTLSINNVPNAVQNGDLKAESQVFDNTVTSIEKYKKEWMKQAQNTWLHRYFILVK
ncbi:hypothetical protein [uncultured Cytophaga sp.]|uniref:hypothetical protein n=1 Tax=uncultured Cytophaga sp. TaxID=160238 RepID=UPI002605260A|nr:hypothetical protein [uncultured Cytophaga sp.]